MSQAIQQIVNLAVNMPHTIQTMNLWGSKHETKNSDRYRRVTLHRL